MTEPGYQGKIILQENLFLTTYNVSLPLVPKLDTDVPPGEPDCTATSILKMMKPALLDDNIPLQVVGDGNCLYRAISRSLYGNEDQHTLLRLMTALEIAEQKNTYNTGLSELIGKLGLCIIIVVVDVFLLVIVYYY